MHCPPPPTASLCHTHTKEYVGLQSRAEEREESVGTCVGERGRKQDRPLAKKKKNKTCFRHFVVATCCVSSRKSDANTAKDRCVCVCVRECTV